MRPHQNANRTMTHSRLLQSLLIAPCLLLGACGGSPQYFRLRADAPAPLTARGPLVGIGPVTLPGYVDRAELVFQSDSYQFQVPGNVSWAGTLTENFTRTLTTDVGARLGSGNVLPYPFPAGTKPQSQVSVSVQLFHAVSGGDAVLEAAWQLEDPATRRVQRRHNVRFTEKIVGDGYGPVVAAESRLVARLADDIAASLR